MIRRTILNATLSVVTMAMTLSVLALDSFTLANRSRAGRVERDGDVPLGAIIRTDERYNRDGLFYGPRGWDYWNLLQNPQPYQDPNLWPDKRPTYFFGRLVMPAGSSLTIHARFPHARYFNILEEVVVGVFKGRTISQSFPAIGGGSLQGLLSMGAIVLVALIPFFAFRELGRVIGQRELWSLLLKRGTRVYTLQSSPQL